MQRQSTGEGNAASGYSGASTQDLRHKRLGWYGRLARHGNHIEPAARISFLLLRHVHSLEALTSKQNSSGGSFVEATYPRRACCQRIFRRVLTILTPTKDGQVWPTGSVQSHNGDQDKRQLTNLSQRFELVAILPSTKSNQSSSR